MQIVLCDTMYHCHMPPNKESLHESRYTLFPLYLQNYTTNSLAILGLIY